MVYIIFQYYLLHMDYLKSVPVELEGAKKNKLKLIQCNIRLSNITFVTSTSQAVVLVESLHSYLCQFIKVSWDQCKNSDRCCPYFSQQFGSSWMLSAQALFGIGFLVTSRAAAVLAQTGTCPRSAAAYKAKKDCLSSRPASTMAQTIKYLGYGFVSFTQMQ